MEPRRAIHPLSNPLWTDLGAASLGFKFANPENGDPAAETARRLPLGAVSALEEGVWGRNLLKVSPQLARPQILIPSRPEGFAPTGPASPNRPLPCYTADQA